MDKFDTDVQITSSWLMPTCATICVHVTKKKMKRKHRQCDATANSTNSTIQITNNADTSYHIRSITYYEQSAKVRIQQPVSIGGYSKLQNGTIEYNKKAYYPIHTQKIKTNLLQDFVESKEKEDTSKPLAPLHPLIQAIHESKWSGTCNVISYRNNFNKLLGTIYNPKKEWQFTLFKYNHCMIFDVEQTDDDKNFIPNLYQQQCAYAGRKFEQEMTSQPTKEEFCTIQQTQLGQIKIILAAEIDGYHPKTKSMVELKTFRTLEGKKDHYTFERYKLLSFWIQSYIAGVPDILCGFRDKQFNVTTAQWFKTRDLPGFGRKHWKPQGCLGFGHDVLHWLQGQTKHIGFYRVHYQPNTMKIELVSLSASTPDYDLSFLV